MATVLVRFQCCEKEVHEGDLLGQDEEGFIVCDLHAQRRYGWRSAPMRPHFVRNPEGKPETIYRPAHGISPLEADQLFWTDVVDRTQVSDDT